MAVRQLALAALSVFIGAGAAAAQDWHLDPTFGTVSLTGGFSPQSVNLVAGGKLDATAIGAAADGTNCVGYIADAPDYRIQLTPGSGSLIIQVTSQSDTTLIVNAPDGNWYCDDDSGGGVNPALTFLAPVASGQYDIWVGTYDPQAANAVLMITEGGAATTPTPPGQPQVAWYVAVNGQQAGPLTLDEVLGQIQAGTLTRDQLVWHSGLSDWAAAGTLPELADAFPPLPPPLPPASNPPPLPPPTSGAAPPPSALPVPSNAAQAPPPSNPAPPAAAGQPQTGNAPSLEAVVRTVITTGLGADASRDQVEATIACLLAAFEPLTPDERRMVADEGINPTDEQKAQLEQAHPGIGDAVQACNPEKQTTTVSLEDGRNLTLEGGNSQSATAIEGGYEFDVDGTVIRYVNGTVTVDGNAIDVPPFTQALLLQFENGVVTLTADP